MKGLARDRKRTAHLARIRQCRKCGASNVTLVKIEDTAGDYFICQDQRACKIWQMRRTK